MASLKVGELRSLLGSFADVLEANQADRAAVRGLRDLCTMFSGTEDKTLATFLRAIKPSVPTNDAKGPKIASVVPVLTSLRTFVNVIAKKDLNDGLDSFLDILRVHSDSLISVFVTKAVSVSKPAVPQSKPKSKSKKVSTSMDDRLVSDYVKRLEAALGDDAKFESLLSELSGDTRIQRGEAVAIASQFYKQTAKDTSRPKALERIRERQDKLMKFKRQPSTAGRPAA
jgi:hypothetical protein